MMLIVEGADGVGKTTFCRRLLKHLPGHVYAHFTRLPPEFDYYWGYADRMSRRIVQDRFHLSEMAYARARGEEPRLNLDEYRLLDARLRQLGAVTVLIAADPDLVASRWDDGQMYDRGVTVRAAEEYLRLAGGFVDAWVDIDLVFRCREDSPWVGDEEVGRTLALYAGRQVMLDRVIAGRSSRPGALH